jgi:hypothetical protein
MNGILDVLHTLEVTDEEVVFLLEALPRVELPGDFDIVQLRTLMNKLRKLKDVR